MSERLYLQVEQTWTVPQSHIYEWYTDLFFKKDKSPSLLWPKWLESNWCLNYDFSTRKYYLPRTHHNTLHFKLNTVLPHYTVCEKQYGKSSTNKFIVLQKQMIYYFRQHFGCNVGLNLELHTSILTVSLSNSNTDACLSKYH